MGDFIHLPKHRDRLWIILHPLDQRTVELDVIYRKPDDIGKIGVAGTEVIDCNLVP